MTSVDSIRSPTPAPRITRLPDGIKLPYVERGAADGVPLVLLHGISDHWRSFTPVLPLLPRDIRALAVTQRGHGGASQPRDGYAIADLASDTLALLDAMEIERAVLAGHSLGALNALRAAIEAPHRVAGLVLAPGFATVANTPAIGELVSAAYSLTDPVDRGFAELLQEQAREPHLPAGLFEAMVEGTLEIPARVCRALMDGIVAFDVGDRLGEVTAATLLLWGERDAFVPRSTQETLLAGLPAAELRPHPGGHTPHWDDPRAYTGGADAVHAIGIRLTILGRRSARGVVDALPSERSTHAGHLTEGLGRDQRRARRSLGPRRRGPSAHSRTPKRRRHSCPHHVRDRTRTRRPGH